MAQGSPAEE
jgi:hypothetical protein